VLFRIFIELSRFYKRSIAAECAAYAVGAGVCAGLKAAPKAAGIAADIKTKAAEGAKNPY